MEQTCRKIHKLKEALKFAPNTKREIIAKAMALGKTIKRLANAAMNTRRIRITTDHSTHTLTDTFGRGPTAASESIY